MRFENTEIVRELTQALDADFFRALAEPVRIEILEVLIQHGPANVSAISDHLAQDRSVVSRHLKHLHDVGLLRCDRQGRERWYDWDCPALETKLDRILTGVRALRIGMESCCE